MSSGMCSTSCSLNLPWSWLRASGLGLARIHGRRMMARSWHMGRMKRGGCRTGEGWRGARGYTAASADLVVNDVWSGEFFFKRCDHSLQSFPRNHFVFQSVLLEARRAWLLLSPLSLQTRRFHSLSAACHFFFGPFFCVRGDTRCPARLWCRRVAASLEAAGSSQLVIDDLDAQVGLQLIETSLDSAAARRIDCARKGSTHIV